MVKKRKKSKIRLKPKKPAVLGAEEKAKGNDLRMKKTKIKIVGVGDGAAQIVGELSREIKGVDFLVANTDWRKLRKFPKEVRTFYFGDKYTKGLGAGGDLETARKAAIACKQEITEFLAGSDLCFLIACLGGGTGSGAAPVFARICQGLNILTFGVFTTPVRFEGEKRAEVARQALAKAKANLNAVLVFPNEKIFQALEKNAFFNEGFVAINRVLSEGLQGLINIVFQPGLINIDFADLKTVLTGFGKMAYLASVEFTKGAKLEEIKKKVFQIPLLSYNFRQARTVLFNVISDSKLSLNEVSEISQQVFNLVHPEAKIIFGVSFDNTFADRIKIVLLAIGGRDNVSFAGEKRAKKQKVSSGKKGGKEKGEKVESKPAVKVRRNAIQVKQEIKVQEENLAAKEKIWETPAILRKGFLS